MANDDPERILILAPTGRDAALSCGVLAKSGIEAVAISNVAAICAGIRVGCAAVILAEEVLVPASMRLLEQVLSEQEPWSDLPILLLTGVGATVQQKSPTAAFLAPLGNVQLLERPVRIATLLSAVQSALRARRRQYTTRTLLQNQVRAVHQRDQFLAMLGHELRNPLGAILMANHLLENARNGELERARATIGRQGRHLARLVDDLLDVARVTSGKIVLRPKPLDLSEVVRRLLLSFESRIRDHHLSAELTMPPEPLIIDGDSDRIEQVVSNLINNAIKYTPAGKIQLQLGREGSNAVLRVRDTGVGIEPELIGRIFELFAQAEATLDRSQGGMGLGLTMVRSLVELHGGQVVAHSEGHGRGSEFVVTLPLSKSELGTELGPSAQPEITRRRNVLVIEDNPDNREMLCGMLQSFGHSVNAAADGPVGVERAAELHPDAVVVDLGLPGIDGFEVARRIRKVLGQEVLLLAVTGYGQPEDCRRALEAGFNVHLTKPVDIEQIRRLLA